MIGIGYDLVSAILILFAAVIPIYFCIKLKNNFRILMMILSVFVLVHGAYHVLEVIGKDAVAQNFVEPASYAILICFGIYYLKIKNVRKIEV